MEITMLFILEIAAVVVLAGIVIFGVIYISRTRERGNPRVSQNTGQAGGEAEQQPTPLKFYKTMSHEAEGQIQVHLYSPEEYRDLLDGDSSGLGKNGEFVAVLKAYKYLEDDWYEVQPERAARLLEMNEADYEMDEVRTALLLRELPPGMPYAARERFT